MSEKFPHKIRPAIENDFAFVISTWLRSYRQLSEMRRMKREMFYLEHRKLIKAIWNSPYARVLVAHHEEDPNTLYGYIAVEVFPDLDRPCLHYLYVKEAFQRFGIGTSLFRITGFDADRLYFTHFTKDRIDNDERRTTYGDVRWRGAETLLVKHPLARTDTEVVDGRKETVQTDGNLFNPYLLWRKRDGKHEG